MNTDAPRGRGRPRTRPDTLVRLRLDVTPAEADLIRAAAQAAGQSQAEYARAVIVAASERPAAKKSR